MARSGKDYCCCCIPLRFAVAIISIIAIALGGFNLWSILRNNSSDSSARISAYISFGIYILLGIFGLLSAAIKTYALAKNFSTLWWTVTIVVTILSIISLILTGTRDKDALHLVCRDTLIQDNLSGYQSGAYEDKELNSDVDSCYRLVLIIAGVSLAIQVLIMSLLGWVASRYTSEVKHMHDNELEHEQQMQPQVQPGAIKA